MKSRLDRNNMTDLQQTFRFTLGAAVVLSVVGCASPIHKAPVEDRGRVGSGLNTPRLPPGAENAGKPGYYTVRPGDTLIRIALESGQNWRDVAAWNNLSNPNLIEIGQVLRVQPPATATASTEAVAVAPATTVPAAKPVSTPTVETRSLDSRPASAPASTTAPSSTTAPTMASGAATTPPASAPVRPAASAAASTTPPATVAPAAPVPAPEARDTDEPTWQWPSAGPLLGSFEEGKRKGLVLGGKAGDPVLAAADGRVVYAGSGLRGYGNLVIIKHNAEYLTAYAHNQNLLVKEDQVVRRGQRIADMGSTDADRVQLHFEIRRQGKPIDPARSLPAR